MISYNTKLLSENPEDLILLKEILEWHKLAFNEASKVKFNIKENSIVLLHSKFYRNFRNAQEKIPAQVVIRGEQECLSAYRSIKSNKHKIDKPICKKNLSMRLDKHLYSVKEPYTISITTSKGRKKFKFALYDKLKNLLDNYQHKDPLIYEKDGHIYISLTFDIKTEPVKQRLCLGVDLGIRVSAATSEGKIIIDKKFNKEKRSLRFLKRKLQSVVHTKKSKSAKRHLKKLRRKERNKNKNQTHLIANEILKTKADTISLENLKGIKAKKHKNQNKNNISQVPFYELRRILIYKAANMGKHIVLVNPAYTSQTDSITGKREGERVGRRFYAKNGLIYDADINAARNIGNRSNLPISQGNLLDGQATVTKLNAGNFISNKLPNLFGSK